MYLSRWHHGKECLAKDLGEIIVDKEDGVTLGEMRVFWWSDHQQYDTAMLYVADREFKKWWPFKNVVWWRRVHADDRLMELEAFVNMVAVAEYPTPEIKQRAMDISKKGFLMKLKGMNNE